MSDSSSTISQNASATSESTVALYRLFDTGGALLYVGISADLGYRWRTHGEEKPEWHRVSGATVEHFPDRTTALAAERAAIKSERPLWNVVHNRTTPVAAILNPAIKHIGIEEARKRLGDLVTAAQQGTDIILTRNRRPVARITRHQEDTMTAQIIIGRLNAWEEQHPYETRQERGLDIWQDVILHLDQYDEESTNRIDQDASDRFALADGAVIRYDAQTRRWYEVY